MDLIGFDLPVEGDEGMQFAWSDGILLQALKQGSWVLLDDSILLHSLSWRG